MLKISNKYLCGLLMVACFLVQGQTNLVPNPSFETYTTCPSGQGQTQNAIGWSTYRDAAIYFNSCASYSTTVGVPKNAAGYQYAACGNGYMGFYTYFPASANNREAIGSKLNSSLVIGTKYYVSFKTSLSDIDSSLWFNTATNNIGVLFSTVPYSVNSPSPVKNFAHVRSTAIITDTLNWTKVFGSFIADSAYKYLAIGNFFDNAHTNRIYFFSDPDSAAAYYVDEVCVSTDSAFSANWNCAMGVEEYNSRSIIGVYPNPFTDYATIDLKNMEHAPLSIILYSAEGQVVKTITGIESEQIVIKRENLREGVCFFEVFDTNRSINKRGKLIIE